jgi:hypothetical protein
MYVHNIRWLSEAAAEAEVEIRAGEHSCVAFCQPCEVSVGDELKLPLHVFGIQSAMRSDTTKVEISSDFNGGLERKVVARISDLSKRLLEVGGISLIVDEDLPGGLALGDYIEFECARIDLW